MGAGGRGGETAPHGDTRSKEGSSASDRLLQDDPAVDEMTCSAARFPFGTHIYHDALQRHTEGGVLCKEARLVAFFNCACEHFCLPLWASTVAMSSFFLRHRQRRQITCCDESACHIGCSGCCCDR